MKINDFLKVGAFSLVIAILILLLIFTIVTIIQLKVELKKNSNNSIHIKPEHKND